MARMETRWKGATDPAVIFDDYSRYHGTLAFDIGANIGQVAHQIASNFERVISVEPCEESFSILEDEVPQNVTCLDCAVSDHNGEVVLKEAQQSIKTGQLVSNEGLHWGPIIGERTIPCRTLDNLADEYGFPDFVKIDTEGHELPIVVGGQKVLQHGPRWLIEVHHSDAGERIQELLNDYEYRIEVVGHNAREGSVLNQHWWIRAWT